jgi:hypothetical protein
MRRSKDLEESDSKVLIFYNAGIPMVKEITPSFPLAESQVGARRTNLGRREPWIVTHLSAKAGEVWGNGR